MNMEHTTRKNNSYSFSLKARPKSTKAQMNYPKGMFKYLQTLDTFCDKTITDAEKIRLYKTYILPTTLKPLPKS